jgi:DNA polymerase-3 subunit delta
MIPTILQQPKSSAVTTIMALTAQTLIIGWAQSQRERGVPGAKLSREVFDVMKQSGSLYTGRAWGEFATACLRAAESWTARAVDDALALLLQADAALKDTRLSSDEQFLSNLVLGVCGVSPRRRAA